MTEKINSEFNVVGKFSDEISSSIEKLSSPIVSIISAFLSFFQVFIKEKKKHTLKRRRRATIKILSSFSFILGRLAGAIIGVLYYS